MKFLPVLFFVLLINQAHGQDTAASILPGKWAICFDTTFSKSYSCNHPFSVYELFPGGYYRGGEVVCQGKKYPVTGEWKFENGNLTLHGRSDSCYKHSPQVYYKIRFLGNDLFYMKGVSEAEDPGRPYYYYFKRVK